MQPLAVTTGTLAVELAVFGALLALGGLLAGLAHRSFLSLTAVFVVLGFVLGEGALGILDFDPTSGFVEILATVALIVLLFRDGLEVEGEMLQRAWHVPLRKLVLAMPLTAAIVALATKALTDLSWAECFLLGALLSPTDPVLSSSVVTNARVPRLVRHSLNLESGMNDGLALPAVLALTAAAGEGPGDFHVVTFVLQDVGVGLVSGVIVGFVAAKIFPRGEGLEEGPTPHQKALYALGIAFVAYGVAVIEPAGNGFISVFVAAITLGLLRPDIHRCFEARSEDIVEVVKLGIFVVFGALLTLPALVSEGVAGFAIVVLLVLVARPLAVFAALAGTGIDTPTKAFMAWFGPKGVATMTFSLLVLAALGGAGERLFNLAALAVFVSIIVHGLTDTPGANWIARRAERAEAGEDGGAGAPGSRTLERSGAA